MGKLNIFILIKSLTPHKKILSIRFPIVPPINKIAISHVIFLFINSQTNAPIPIILTAIIIMNGTGNDREIPVLNVGRISVVSLRYLRL